MEVENHSKRKPSAKTTAEPSLFGGGLAHLPKLAAVTALFVPLFCPSLQAPGGRKYCQGLHVLKHMLLLCSALGGERLPGCDVYEDLKGT